MSDAATEKKINLRVEIRRNSDGAIKTDVWPNWTYREFWWTDGSAACDCNRAAWFEQPERDRDFDCGRGEYSVRLSDNETNESLYNEIDP